MVYEYIIKFLKEYSLLYLFIIIINKLKFNKLFKFLFYLKFKNKNIKRYLNLKNNNFINLQIFNFLY